MKELGRPRSLRRIIAHSLYSSLREKERALKTTSQDERLLTRPVARLSTPRRAKPVRAKAPQMMIRGGADCHGMNLHTAQSSRGNFRAVARRLSSFCAKACAGRLAPGDHR